MADRIVVLEGGVVRQVGRPLDLYENPDNRFVAGFIGSPAMNFFEARVEGEADGRLALRLAAAPEAAVTVAMPARRPASGDLVTVGVRPEHVEVTDGAGIEAREEITEELGSVAFIHARLAGGQPVLVERRGDRVAGDNAGGLLRLRFRPDRILLFDRAGERLR